MYAVKTIDKSAKEISPLEMKENKLVLIVEAVFTSFWLYAH
jgi:hypothetical protein